MDRRAPLAIVLAFATILAYSRARADEHEHAAPAARAEAPKAAHPAAHATASRPSPPPRAAPPRFQPHPAGVHPKGATVPQHQVRVMAPKVVAYASNQWNHLDRPEFSRPFYYWDWAIIHQVTCVAEDSYGDQYPVTEATPAGFGLNSMSVVEDDALDRCAAESGGDHTCYLATCSHF
jgi:hypothetical protein